MGWNTTVVIYNDALSDIAKDSEFGDKLARAVLAAAHAAPQHLSANPDGTEIVATAGRVIEAHHADYDVLVSIGGNDGREVTAEDILQMAASLVEVEQTEGAQRVAEFLREKAAEVPKRIESGVE